MTGEERAALIAIILLILGMITGLTVMRALGFGGFIPVLVFGSIGILAGNLASRRFRKSGGQSRRL